jgi:membrane protease YdiL (CAAX protease family)
MAFVAGCVSASFFAAMHLIGETSLSRAFVTGGSALLVGAVVSIFALKTQRLGPGLVTHAVFNLLIVLPAMAWWS